MAVQGRPFLHVVYMCMSTLATVYALQVKPVVLLMRCTYYCTHAVRVCVMEKVSVVGWGRTTEGQLGLGGIEETTITQPRSAMFLCICSAYT